ncbi:MAG: acylphosphatase [Planctomycetes bacterium]|nr:acylphosphatase [Planctomycetota bacterium]
MFDIAGRFLTLRGKDERDASGNVIASGAASFPAFGRLPYEQERRDGAGNPAARPNRAGCAAPVGAAFLLGMARTTGQRSKWMSGEARIRVGVRYTGRVQGVGFRATCRWIASSHPVTGRVRNEPDGSVWLEAQGSPFAVGAFLEEVAGRLNENIAGAAQMALRAVPDETDFVIER